MTVAPRASVGDRVERAIEDHADVEHVIEREEAQPTPRRRSCAGLWLAITAISLYLVFPSLLDLFSSWKDLAEFGAGWFGRDGALQLATLACLWVLQHLAIRAQAWRPVIDVAAGRQRARRRSPPAAARWARRCSTACSCRPASRGARPRPGLTAVNLLVFAAVLALPVLAVPRHPRRRVDQRLVQAAIVGPSSSSPCSRSARSARLDAPLRWIGRPPARAQPPAPPPRAARPACPSGCLPERDRILETFGPRWKGARGHRRPLVLRLPDAAGRAGGGRRARARRSSCWPSAGRRSWPRSR